MDNQDQRRTHTTGHESHEVHVCHNCGWPFPNPHPSAKHRRAHKKICGTIEGYKRFVSEEQTRSNASDDEHRSDDDHKIPGPNALDTDKKEKSGSGIGEKLNTSDDEVFSDADADLSDSGLSLGIKERLQGSSDSATHVEIFHRQDPEFSGSNEDDGFNDHVSPLIVKSRDDSQMQNPKILQGEMVEDGNTLALQGQLSGSTMDLLSSSSTDLRTEESTFEHSDDCFLSCDSHPSKAEATPHVLLENNISAGENETDCSLISVAKESDLKGKDEIRSDKDRVEIVVSSDNVVGETCEGVSTLDCQVADGAFNLKENNSAEFLSVIPQDDLPVEVMSTVSTNASTSVQVESAHEIQFATSSDVKTLQEKGEGNVDVFTLLTHDDKPEAAHPQSEYEDFKNHEKVVSQDPPSLCSFEALKYEQDDLKDTKNNFLFKPCQLSEKSVVLFPYMHVLDGSLKKELVNYEPVAEDLHTEESIEVSPVKLTIESSQRLEEIESSMNAVKTESNESHLIHFSQEPGSDDVCKNLQQISVPEGSFMIKSIENPIDASFDSATIETTSVISIDDISHQEKNRMEINDVAVDGKCGGANVENDIGIRIEVLQPSDLHLEVRPFSDDAGEMGEKCDKSDGQCTVKPIVKDASLPKSAGSHFECPILSEVVMEGSARRSKDIECTNKGPLSGAQEDIKDGEINSISKLNEECNRFVGTSANSHQAQDAELLVKAAEDNQNGEPGREVSGITAVPVQDPSDNNVVKLGSSGIDTSVDSGSQCDSLEGNWGSALEALPSTEAGKSNLNSPKAASEGQRSEKPEMFEPPSFMTLVEPGYGVSPKSAASEVQKGPVSQHPNSTSSPVGWFPTLTQVNNESEGRKRNEEMIAKVTNWSTSKQRHTPLKSLVGEAAAAHSDKPKLPKLEENSVNQKNRKVVEDNGSALTTVNSILGPESPAAAQSVKEEGGKEWNSPARYPAEIKRENRKVKSRPYWIQFVCCSSVGSQ